MSTKASKDSLVSTSFRLDPVALSQIDWVTKFCKHLSVPGITQRMVIARAVQFYVEYAEDLLITYHCQSRHKDVITEQKALIKAGESRKSAFSDGKLPESLTESDRLLGYSDLVKGTVNQKKPKLPGIRMDKRTRNSVESLLKEREAAKSQ